MHRCVNYALAAVGVKSITYSDDHLTKKGKEMYRNVIYLASSQRWCQFNDSSKTSKMRKSSLRTIITTLNIMDSVSSK